jgi:hypothetical protein
MSQGNSLCSYLKQTKKPFVKKREQQGKTGPVWELLPVGRQEDIRKGCRRVNMVEYYALVNENGKMRPAEAIPGIRGG